MRADLESIGNEHFLSINFPGSLGQSIVSESALFCAPEMKGRWHFSNRECFLFSLFLSLYFLSQMISIDTAEEEDDFVHLSDDGGDNGDEYDIDFRVFELSNHSPVPTVCWMTFGHLRVPKIKTLWVDNRSLGNSLSWNYGGLSLSRSHSMATMAVHRKWHNAGSGRLFDENQQVYWP